MNTLSFSCSQVRAARAQDYPFAAPLIIQAMEDLAQLFVKGAGIEKATALFEHFFQQPGNQYSFENTLVFEQQGQLAGTLTAYDGGLLHELRAPFIAYIQRNFDLGDFDPEDETQPGEFYIDTLSVHPNFQGHGIGSKLIGACLEKAEQMGHQKVGLIVDQKNPKAERLYQKLGFDPVQHRFLLGGEYLHMQYSL